MLLLREKKCEPCTGKEKPFEKDEIQKFIDEINEGWKVLNGKKLKRTFPFGNFKRGMVFAQNVALIAEQEQHHPDLCIHYNNVEVELTTHAIDGLSENDFIMAAKIDEL